MFPRYAVCLFLPFLTVGCGKTESHAPVAPPASTASSTDSAPVSIPETEAVPTTPPGQIELPKDFNADAAGDKAAPAEPGSSGGFVMPNAQPGATVTAQRPVLDEAAGLTAVKLTAEPLAATLQRAAQAGKVCVVDVWSLSCQPCLKEFPGLVKLSQEFPDRVVCMSINTDFDGRKRKPAESYRTSVEGFLRSTGATFENYLCETASEEVYASLKVASIPAVLVYDERGQLVKTFADTGEEIGFTYDQDIAPFVRSLLKP